MNRYLLTFAPRGGSMTVAYYRFDYLWLANNKLHAPVSWINYTISLSTAAVKFRSLWVILDKSVNITHTWDQWQSDPTQTRDIILNSGSGPVRFLDRVSGIQVQGDSWRPLVWCHLMLHNVLHHTTSLKFFYKGFSISLNVAYYVQFSTNTVNSDYVRTSMETGPSISECALARQLV